jgi:hypothetical protein
MLVIVGRDMGGKGSSLLEVFEETEKNTGYYVLVSII